MSGENLNSALLQQVLQAVDRNTQQVSEMRVDMTEVQKDVGYLKKARREKEEQEERERVRQKEAELADANTRKSRIFGVALAAFSAVLGAISAGVSGGGK